MLYVWKYGICTKIYLKNIPVQINMPYSSSTEPSQVSTADEAISSQMGQSSEGRSPFLGVILENRKIFLVRNWLNHKRNENNDI